MAVVEVNTEVFTDFKQMFKKLRKQKKLLVSPVASLGGAPLRTCWMDFNPSSRFSVVVCFSGHQLSSANENAALFGTAQAGHVTSMLIFLHQLKHLFNNRRKTLSFDKKGQFLFSLKSS